MILTSHSLSSFQRCPRRYALEREFHVERWRPKVLLETLLRQGIFHLSNGGDVETLTEELCTRFLESAARPGLDIGGDPYCLARDMCAIISTVLEAVSRMVLLAVRPGQLVAGNPDWQVTAWRDESGLLHRWICAERWDEDTKYQQLHSWSVFGDCAAAQLGMTLHVIEIGRYSRGHQLSPWCRAYRHPAILGKYRFRKVDGTPLESSWIPVWFQDSDKNEASTWVDLMQADKLELIHHLNIREPLQEHVEQFRREIAVEARRIEALGTWRDEPMRRTSCDLPMCPWQPVCYGPPVDVESIGGFNRS